MRTLIYGGTVVSAGWSGPADVLVDGERIAEVGTGLDPDTAGGRPVDRTIDATGRYVIPGGIDVHTHMQMPFGGTYSADDFASGTAAAAWGGTTTIVDFAIQPRGGALREGLEEWHRKAEGVCAIDYGFHMIMSDVNEQSLKEMDAVAEDGVTSFKLFMAYPGVFYSDDGQILRALRRAGDTGALIMLHAENGIAIDVLVAEALAAGRTQPIEHGLARPASMEGEATGRAVELARLAGAPLYIVHLSAEDALREVQSARDRGEPVYAETCPQYLFLTLDDLRGNETDGPFGGAKYVCSPPLRPAEHHDALWRGLRTNDLQAVSTDHCPFCFVGQKDLGRDDFSKIPNGLPGVEHRLDLLHDGGVRTGRISLERWVELCSTTPARLFGLHPRKGHLAPGADADVVVYDPEARHVLSADTHHMAVDYSCYEGREVVGRAETVLSRGSVVIDRRQWTGRAGHGRFVPRGNSTYDA